MELIRVTQENLEQEHLLRHSRQQGHPCAWKKGMAFKVLSGWTGVFSINIREKCFIEYIPAEDSWAPISPAFVFMERR